MLTAEGIDNTLHLSNHEGLKRFLDGEVDICISCKKLQTGFSYPPADVGIIVSTATSTLTLVQTCGRIFRPLEGKHADVYILQAKDTSDENIDLNKAFGSIKVISEDMNTIKV
jgi:superfamily II DNA or RNA helicase